MILQMKTQSYYIVTIAVLLLIIIIGAYKFIILGSTSTTEDNRVVIHLDDKERHIVLSEMRGFLKSVQIITTGIATSDMQLVSDAARQSGNDAQRDIPASLVGKLPLDFKKLGFDTHSRFDQLALDAESFADSQHTINQLSELMKNCIACHEMFQFQQVSKQ